MSLVVALKFAIMFGETLMFRVKLTWMGEDLKSR